MNNLLTREFKISKETHQELAEKYCTQWYASKSDYDRKMYLMNLGAMYAYEQVLRDLEGIY